MEQLISIDKFGRMVVPKAIRKAAHLRTGSAAKIRLKPNGIIEIEPIGSPDRRLKKVGRFLIGVGDGTRRYNAAHDVRLERERG